MENNIEYSVVIPVYNEGENLEELYNRLTKVINELSISYEIIFVDDGSKDNSWRIIEDLHKQNSNVKGIKLSRNFGQHIAIAAGIDSVNGKVVTVMDADLQTRPEDISKAIGEYKKGYDVIWAVAEQRKDGVIARYGAKIFYSIFNKLANINIPKDIVFMTFSSKAIDAIKNFREKRRMPVGIYTDIGFKSAKILVKKEARYAGSKKYNFRKKLLVGLTGIIGYSKIPLRISTYLGIIVSTFSLIFGLIILIRRVFFQSMISGYASMIIAIAFIGGIQLLMLGILGEYIGVMIDEVKNKPLYIIEDRLL